MRKRTKWIGGSLLALGVIGAFGSNDPATAPVSDTVPTTTMTTTTATPTTTTSPTTTITPSATPTTTKAVVVAPMPVVKVPAPAPKYTPKPTYKAPAPTPKSVYYANCSEARAAGAAPLYVGDPGYRSGLDRDKDGVACES